MFQKIKYLLYFPIASYFAFFAKLFLLRWRPRIIVITGSSGKTTLLHMIASQLGSAAKYSYHANSSFGIPFDILGITRSDLTFLEWPLIFLKAPFLIFRKIPQEKIYVVEADCDRPKEGRFLGKLLKPEVTLWLNVSRTHSMNFEKLVTGAIRLEEAIASEFVNFACNTQSLVIANGDDEFIKKQLSVVSIDVNLVSLEGSGFDYKIERMGTKFVIAGEEYKFNYLLPRSTFYQILMTKKLVGHLGIKFRKNFPGFVLPPGRSSVFKGIKDTAIIDSTYNANLDSMRVMLDLFDRIRARVKWVVLGDMLEQGQNEKSEHKNLAREVLRYKFDRVILMGPRVAKYTQPLINNSVAFERPDEVLFHLKQELQGGETILFKGARFLEGVIENLLLDKGQKNLLVRREKVWQVRREKFGL